MSSILQTLEKEILEALSSQREWKTIPNITETWITLVTVEPAPTSTRAELKEAKYTGYKPVKIAPTAWEKPTSTTPSEVTNKEEVKFPESTGGEASKVKYFAIVTAEAGGTMIAWGELGSEKVIEKEATPSFAAKTLKWTLQ